MEFRTRAYLLLRNLPRSAPLVDFPSIGIQSGAGSKYPSADTPRDPDEDLVQGSAENASESVDYVEK